MSINQNLSQIQRQLKGKYNFRYNVVTGSVEFRLKGKHKYEKLDDFMLNSMVIALQSNGLEVNPGRLKDLLISNFSSRYDPFEDFVKRLPKWDGERNFIKELANSVKTTNQEFWINAFKKWFVALVASVIDSNVINHQMIVLVGPQGIGKSRWIQAILPAELKQFIHHGSINPSNKDTMVLLSECILIDLDELQNLSKYEYGALKEIITKPSIKLRRPYGRLTEDLIRRASFIASVNQATFLADPTGSRRYLCFEVLEINSDCKVDRYQVFAQAKALFEKGFKFYFDGEEIAEIVKNNDQFQEENLEEELLQKFFRKPTDDNTIGLMATEVLQILEEESGFKGKLNIKKLGQALRKYFDRYSDSKKNRWLYKVEQLS